MGGVGIRRSSGARVLDLVEAGPPVVDVARDLGTSGQSIYTWRRQDQIDKGAAAGPDPCTVGDSAEPGDP